MPASVDVVEPGLGGAVIEVDGSREEHGHVSQLGPTHQGEHATHQDNGGTHEAVGKRVREAEDVAGHGLRPSMARSSGSAKASTMAPAMKRRSCIARVVRRNAVQRTVWNRSFWRLTRRTESKQTQQQKTTSVDQTGD